MNVSQTLLVRGVLGLVLLAAWWHLLPRGQLVAALAAGLVLVGLGGWHALALRRRARDAITGLRFPRFLRQKVRGHHPHLDEAQVDQVEAGLRQFFLAAQRANGRFVAMPSKAADTLWHEFILHTRAYETFCRDAFGRLLHHTPAEALPAGAETSRSAAGLRRAWRGCCEEEGIDPKHPDRLPLLFALDTTLGIEGGYRYVPDCHRLGADRGDTHCGSALGCGGGSSGSDGHGDGDGGGDGGGGCGGGD